MTRNFLAFVVSIVSIILAPFAVQAEETNPPFVLTETVTANGFQAGSLAGFVQPRISAHLGFPIAGRLLSRDVSVGDRVARGDVLATLEADTLIAGVEAAQANLRIAQAQLDNASSTHARQVELTERGVAPQATLDAAKSALDVAGANFDVAYAALEQANDLVSNAALIAPMDGVILSVTGEVGQVTGPGHSVVVLVQSELRDAEVDLPDHLVEKLANGDPAEISLELNPAITTAGHIREISPSADPATRLVRVRIALEDPPPAFRLGSTVIVTFPGLTASLPISVASGAFMGEGSKRSVWIVKPDGRIHATPVETGDNIDGRVTVFSGLNIGDVVVIAGVEQLSEGQKVQLYGEVRP